MFSGPHSQNHNCVHPPNLLLFRIQMWCLQTPFIFLEIFMSETRQNVKIGYSSKEMTTKHVFWLQVNDCTFCTFHTWDERNWGGEINIFANLELVGIKKSLKRRDGVGAGSKKKVFKETLFQDRQDKSYHRLYLRDDNDEVDMMTAMVITINFDDIVIDKPDKSYPPTIFLFFVSILMMTRKIWWSQCTLMIFRDDDIQPGRIHSESCETSLHRVSGSDKSLCKPKHEPRSANYICFKLKIFGVSNFKIYLSQNKNVFVSKSKMYLF